MALYGLSLRPTGIYHKELIYEVSRRCLEGTWIEFIVGFDGGLEI